MMALGYRSVDEMLETLSNHEYRELLAYFEEEGFPEDRADLRTAQIRMTISNMSGKYFKENQKVSDFMPKFWQDAPKPRVPLTKKEKAYLKGQSVKLKAALEARRANKGKRP